MIVGYPLSFDLQLGPPGFMGRGRDVLLRMTWREPVSEAALREAEMIVIQLDVLAGSGALAGEFIEPWESDMSCYSAERIAPNRLAWRLAAARVDDSTATILAHAVRWLPDMLRPLVVELVPEGYSGDLRRPEFGERTGFYPGVHAAVAGMVDVDPDLSGDMFAVIDLARSRDEASLQELNGRVQAWLAAVELGLYPTPPLAPEDCSIQPDNLEFYPEHAELALIRFRAHPEALDGLASAVFGVNHHGSIVTGLTIE